MKQRQREQVQRGCAVGTVVLLAWLCRVLPLEGLPSGLQEACGILRSLLYLSLFAGWGISLYNRTVHPQVRRLLLNVDLLMLFWILVRTLRFQLNTPPEIDRMLGYLYYAPMLGIPVLCVQLVLTVDRSERYRLSAWARMLWLPSAVLLELVLTNDLHQQVFRLQQPWNENYQYGWLFGLVVGWIVICILLAFGIIAHKSRNPRILRRLPLPAIPMVLLGVYAVLYGFHFPLIKQFLGDMTIVHCLMTAASLEGGLRCGLIQSNTGYEELLRVTSLAVQLVDRQGNVYCCSENGRMADRRELQAAMHGTVQLDEHTLLRSAPVQGGYVMWQTDITELVENMERLKENRTELAERNYLEQQNYEVERKINALREKNRLYDLLQRQLAPQIIRMNQLLTRYRTAPEADRRQLLGQVAVLGAYLKRGGQPDVSGPEAPVCALGRAAVRAGGIHQQPGAGRGGVRHGGDPRGPASGRGGSGLLQPVRVGGGGGAGAAGCPVRAGRLEGPPAEPLSFGGDRGGPESRLPCRCAGGPRQPPR